MERNLSNYLTKLIELDAKAVDFKGSRDSELVRLEAGSRDELRSIEDILDDTAVEARQEHDRIIEETRQQVKGISEAAGAKMDKVQAYFTSIKEKAAGDIWEQLLEIER
jgi:hypothetical protein